MGEKREPIQINRVSETKFEVLCEHRADANLFEGMINYIRAHKSDYGRLQDENENYIGSKGRKE